MTPFLLATSLLSAAVFGRGLLWWYRVSLNRTVESTGRQSLTERGSLPPGKDALDEPPPPGPGPRAARHTDGPDATGQDLTVAGPQDTRGTGVAVVVPVLAEQARLDRLVKHFHRLREGGEQMSLVLVSTSREPEAPSGVPSTPQLCEAWARRLPWVCHHHAQDPGGMMASQLNTALRDCDTVHAERLIAVYNADSAPAVGSIQDAARLLHAVTGPAVVQQYALYLRNWRALGRAPLLPRMVLRAAAAWQCRWSMGFERYHATRNARADSRRKAAPFTYVIGHGLITDRALLSEVGMFTEEFPNEDAYLSVALAARGTRVIPHPRWEVADSPDSVRGLLVQQRVWFRGPAAAFRYARDLRARGVADWGDLVRPTVALFNHALGWLFGVLPIAAVVLTACTGHLSAAAAALLALLVFLVPANDRALRLSWAELGGTAISRRERLEAAVGAPLAFGIHSLAACWATALSVRQALFDISVDKPKTPMRELPEES